MSLRPIVRYLFNQMAKILFSISTIMWTSWTTTFINQSSNSCFNNIKDENITKRTKMNIKQNWTRREKYTFTSTRPKNPFLSRCANTRSQVIGQFFSHSDSRDTDHYQNTNKGKPQKFRKFREQFSILPILYLTNCIFVAASWDNWDLWPTYSGRRV